MIEEPTTCVNAKICELKDGFRRNGINSFAGPLMKLRKRDNNGGMW